MKAGIKAGDLRRIRQTLEAASWPRLYGWCNGLWDEFVQVSILPLHHHLLALSYPAVNNAMPNTQHPRAVPL
jgi:hypothetical protein